MPRGKKVIMLTVDDLIAHQQMEKSAIEASKNAIETHIAKLKQQLKAKKKEAQKVERDIAALQTQKENEDAIRVAVEQKAAVTKAVEQLMRDGKTAEDILRIFCLTW